MTVYSFRVSTYARNIYIFGTNRLTARDGFVGVPVDYYTPVQQYAKINYLITDIEDAFTKTWINEQEYQETLAL
jgi:hypothetical protein